MSIRSPPTLLKLAAESLLRDEASAIAALEYLPAELFPQLFSQAYYGKHYSILKAITQAWPFAVLPLGSLRDRIHVNVLKAVLDGLDVLLAQKVRPRKYKLQVLDLRYIDPIQEYSPIFPVTKHRSSPNMEHPLAPVEVFLNLNFNESNGKMVFMYIIPWAQQRKELLHLCCKMLKVDAVPFHRVREVLDVVQLDCIQQVELNCTWNLTTLETFALYMGQMRNVQKLCLLHIEVLGEEEEEEEEEEEMDWEEEGAGEEQEEQISFPQFFSQMLSPLHLCELALEPPSFLRGHLHQMLSCLQYPLEHLVIRHCRHLTHSDLEHLFQCPKLRQLKSLGLYCASLTDFSLEPLRDLLEALAPTLQVLHLEDCAMVDSQVEAILPVLSCCHQLREFTIIKNRLSVATVEKLLRHTAGLCSLEHEYYPVPWECYTAQGTVNQDILTLVQAELKGILRELGQPRTIRLASDYHEFYYVEFS